jgi:hypothetical protein
MPLVITSGFRTKDKLCGKEDAGLPLLVTPNPFRWLHLSLRLRLLADTTAQRLGVL